MKKSLAAAAAASLMALGVVGTTAVAAQADCGYITCVTPTPKSNVPDSVNVGDKIKIKYKAKFPGNVSCTGQVKFVFTGPNGFRVVKIKSYDGGGVSAKSSKIPDDGIYKVSIKFVSSDNSFCNDTKKVKDTVEAD